MFSWDVIFSICITELVIFTVGHIFPHVRFCCHCNAEIISTWKNLSQYQLCYVPFSSYSHFSHTIAIGSNKQSYIKPNSIWMTCVTNHSEMSPYFISLIGNKLNCWGLDWHKHSTRSPFLTWLSQRAQSGRWSSFGEQVWFPESNIVLVISFYLLFYLLILFLI